MLVLWYHFRNHSFKSWWFVKNVVKSFLSAESKRQTRHQPPPLVAQKRRNRPLHFLPFFLAFPIESPKHQKAKNEQQIQKQTREQCDKDVDRVHLAL
jgi:hypothetical protein